MKSTSTALALLAPLLLAACTHDEVVRSETMTAGAGNAIAYNSVLQIIDPRPLTSLNTRIAVSPASRGTGRTAAGYDASSMAVPQ
jgi:hypothetical protein